MSKMNWEHRNKMQKVWDNPAPRPRSKPRKKKKAKARRYDPRTTHVLLESKWPGSCKECARPVQVGDKVYWSTNNKYVVHDYCFEVFMRESNTGV